MSGSKAQRGIHGKLVDLYDVFVDWKGRLAREMPGVLRQLNEVGARKVLDAGCGTGRHIQALLDEGYDAFGSDSSEAMLAAAAAQLGDDRRLFHWTLGESVPADLRAAAPFDAITCLGNVWPGVSGDAQVRAASTALHDLLRPGGLLLMGLKAVDVRREQGTPYMPLLKRRHEGSPLFFVRFVDFDVPAGPDGEDLCDFHMVVVRGDGAGEAAAEIHDAHRVRVWSPTQLSATFTVAGFDEVQVSGSIEDPLVEPTTEDVFVHARRS